MDPSFHREGDTLVPSRSAISVWSDEMVNGHHVAGLVAWAVERDHHDPELQLSRLTIDMFRPVPMRPLHLRTSLARDGRRLRVVDVSVLDGEVEVTRGSALLLRRSEGPGSEPWSPPVWDMPAPESLPPPEVASVMSWEVRRGNPWGQGQGRVWMREMVPFVAGEELSPMVRAALAADFANPLVNAGEGGLAFINADLTFNLVRDPVGEWIGMEASGHLGAAGIAVGAAWLYDLEGRIGHATVAAMPDGRLRQRAAGS